MKKTILAIALGLIALSCSAFNPIDARNAESEAQAEIHAISREIGRLLNTPAHVVEEHMQGGSKYPERLIKSVKMSGKQYRAVLRILAERRQKAQQAFVSRGLPAPDWTQVQLNP